MCRALHRLRDYPGCAHVSIAKRRARIWIVIDAARRVEVLDGRGAFRRHDQRQSAGAFGAHRAGGRLTARLAQGQGYAVCAAYMRPKSQTLLAAFLGGTQLACGHVRGFRSSSAFSARSCLASSIARSMACVWFTAV